MPDAYSVEPVPVSRFRGPKTVRIFDFQRGRSASACGLVVVTNDRRTVYLNGEYLPETEARISIFDRGFLMADSVYKVTSVPEQADQFRRPPRTAAAVT